MTALLLLVTGIAADAFPPVRQVLTGAVAGAAHMGLYESLRRGIAPGLVPPFPPLDTLMIGLSTGVLPSVRGATCEAVALAHPDDAEMWFGFAEILHKIEGNTVHNPPAKTSATDAYQKAIALAPHSFPVRFRYTLHLLSCSGDWSVPHDGLVVMTVKPRTQDQTVNLRAAQSLLAELEREVPDDAASAYYLAWTYFAEDSEAEALRTATQATTRGHWTLHDPEASAARLRVLTALTDPQRVSDPVSSANIDALDRIREVGFALTASGDRLRAAGRDQEAVACYESVTHLGHLMRTQAYSTCEALWGYAVTALPTHGFRFHADEKAVGEVTDRRERDAQIGRLRRHRLEAYFREHGRPDLGTAYELEAGTADASQEVLRTAAREALNAEHDAFFGPTIGSALGMWALAVLFVYIAGAVMLCAMLGLARGRQPKASPVTYANWLLPFTVALIPGTLAGIYYDTRPQPFSTWSAQAIRVIPIACGLGVLLWLIVVGLIARRRRRAVLDATQPDKPSMLGLLNALIPPTLAALLLASVLFLAPLASGPTRVVQLERAIAAKGEVAYWDINGKTEALLRQRAADQPPQPPR